MRETMFTAQPRVTGRDAGPGGRAFRILAGATGLVPIIVKLDGAGAVLAGIAWLVVVAAAFVGIVALLRPWLDGSRERVLSPWTGSAILLLPLMAYPFGLIPEGPAVGVRLFTDGSVLLAGLIGYGGLEMAALATLVLRTRPRLYSQYNVVDLVENAPERAQRRPLARAASTLGILAFSWYWIVPNLVVEGSPLHGAKETTERLDGVVALVIAGVALLLLAARVTTTTGRTAWALAALLVFFAAGAAVGAMPDALYAVIILTGAVVAVAAAVRPRASRPSRPQPGLGTRERV
ncbi:DUF6410 domain-containing protein [Couchioplanes azureus]|uniref:DUF6410 domain-containing protein n=1 Tax=Couchioplanes caeruleus TaxID=56438 RepID=UPI001670D7C2|nr:DUF6410 domain-containing protein [Couchioplanes caeruleus]GGQ80872.1 hypothetical protein GCM10010166_58720 [Couchioplanes caeruleus subsp. azureus]